MVRGTVVRFDEVRGYGFIAPETGGEDVFVHINDLGDEKTSFTTGTPVEFEIADGERGLKAFAVRVLKRPSEPVVPAVARAGSGTGKDPDDPNEPLSDVLSDAEFTHELTELFLRTVPELTGDQIVRLRRGLVGVAVEHGWVEG